MRNQNYESTRVNLRGWLEGRGYYKALRMIMTASVIIAGLLPIMWSNGTGTDVMKRIAAPMVGGVVTSVLMELAIYPVIYFLWKSWKLKKEARMTGNTLKD